MAQWVAGIVFEASPTPEDAKVVAVVAGRSSWLQPGVVACTVLVAEDRVAVDSWLEMVVVVVVVAWAVSERNNLGTPAVEDQ